MTDSHLVPMNSHATLIDLHHYLNDRLPRFLSEWTRGPMGRLLAINEINAFYTHLLAFGKIHASFSSILRLLDMTYRITSDDLATIPDHGPLVVANHPFGGIEGIVLGDFLQRIRPDTKILGNHLFEKIAPIRDSIIPVDPFDSKSSVPSNANTFRKCLRWLKTGNCLVVFPAGEVSHFCQRQ